MSKTLPSHAERIKRMMEGGVATVESRLDNLYLYSVINSARAWCLRQDYIKFKRWSPEAIQQYFPAYEDYFQDSVCYTRFELPIGVIQANAMDDGLVYFGSSSTKILRTNNFYRIQNRSVLSDFLNNSYMSPANGRYIGVLIEGLIVTVISQNPFQNPMMSAVFQEPNLLPDYNLQKDFYPLSSDMDDVMYQHILQTTMGVVYSKHPDSPYDSQEPVKANPPTPVK